MLNAYTIIKLICDNSLNIRDYIPDKVLKYNKSFVLLVNNCVNVNDYNLLIVGICVCRSESDCSL